MAKLAAATAHPTYFFIYAVTTKNAAIVTIINAATKEKESSPYTSKQ